jgi:hypothetical protein
MNEEDNFLNEMKKATAMRGSELKSKFKTMLFTYRNALGMLSGLKNELDEVVNHIDNLDIETISNFYKPVLDKANDLVMKIENLDYDVKNHSDMKAYLSSIETQLKSHNIDTLVKKLDEVKYQIVKAKEAEERRQEELERKRREVELERQQREEIITFNGLMWEKETHIMNWNDAMEYAKNLQFGGYSDWRLPTKEELEDVLRSYKRDRGVIMSFLSPRDWLEDKGFPRYSWYWSSTLFSGMTNGAWVVPFYRSDVNSYSKANSYSLRCVRAGQ